MAEFEQEDEAFRIMLPDLLQNQEGKFVAIQNRKLIDSDTDEFALAERPEETHRGEFVLVRKVTATGLAAHLESPEGE